MVEPLFLAVAVIFIQQLVTICFVTQVSWETLIVSFINPQNMAMPPSTAASAPIMNGISEPPSYIHLAWLLNDGHRHVPVSSLLCLVQSSLLDGCATVAQ